MMDVSFLENLEQRFYEGEHSRLLGRIRKRQDQERTGRPRATLLYLWEASFYSPLSFSTLLVNLFLPN